MPTSQPILFARALLRWYDRHGRHDLPWQQRQTAYRVWISEIMLQQTQVTTVIPYYQRFMQRFPTLSALARAPLDDVLGLWTGLGYYARARHLHAAAQRVLSDYKGRFPKSVIDLMTLPGVGRSTAGAIVSLTWDIPAPILDGNVKRVLARFFAIDQPINLASVQARLWELATVLTPQQRCRDYNQAMMDLGATVCTRTRPQCSVCPLQQDCQAFQANATQHYPVRTQKTARPNKQTCVLLIKNLRGEILLEKRPSVGIWGGLWSAPECEDFNAAVTWCHHHGLSIQEQQQLPTITHIFTHFKLTMIPWVLTVNVTKNLTGPHQVWYDATQPPPGGLPAPMVQLLKQTVTSNED